MRVILFLLGFRVVNAMHDAIIFVLASPSLLPFRGKQLHGCLHVEKKTCVREMTVEVGSFSGCPGYHLGNLRVGLCQGVDYTVKRLKIHFVHFGLLRVSSLNPS